MKHSYVNRLFTLRASDRLRSIILHCKKVMYTYCIVLNINCLSKIEVIWRQNTLRLFKRTKVRLKKSYVHQINVYIFQTTFKTVVYQSFISGNWELIASAITESVKPFTELLRFRRNKLQVNHNKAHLSDVQ